MTETSRRPMLINGSQNKYSVSPGIKHIKRELTQREKQVLRLVADGLTAKEAAGYLGLSTSAANLYLSNSRIKLGVANTASAVATAIRNGIIQ